MTVLSAFHLYRRCQLAPAPPLPGQVGMSEVIMYCTRFCPYCISAERLLKAKGVTIKKIPVDHDMDMWRKMEQLTKRNTVPQIFIGDHHVGGYDDLAALERAGKLDPLLEPILSPSRA